MERLRLYLCIFVRWSSYGIILIIRRWRKAKNPGSKPQEGFTGIFLKNHKKKIRMPGVADKQLVPAWGDIMTLLVTNMTRTQFTDITDVNMNCLWDGHLHLVILYDTFSASFCLLLSFDHAQKNIVLIDNSSLTVWSVLMGWPIYPNFSVHYVYFWAKIDFWYV